jgi:hypothetical protein
MILDELLHTFLLLCVSFRRFFLRGLSNHTTGEALMYRLDGFTCRQGTTPIRLHGCHC